MFGIQLNGQPRQSALDDAWILLRALQKKYNLSVGAIIKRSSLFESMTMALRFKQG
jgi:hypothetical protein